MTDAERALRAVPRRDALGHSFRRQAPPGPHIVDFVCLARKLVVEIDGGQHAKCASDLRRDGALSASGFRVLRFWNNEVLRNLDGVVAVILQALLHPHPGPPPQAGEGGTRGLR